MKKILLFSFLLTMLGQAYGQDSYPVNGSHDIRPGMVAFTNANIVVSAEQTISNGTMLVKGQNIESVGTGTAIPKGYMIIDLKGKYIYPSLVDAFSTYGLPDIPRTGFNRTRQQVFTSTKKGAYSWNEAIRPEMTASSIFATDVKKAEELKKLGLGS